MTNADYTNKTVLRAQCRRVRQMMDADTRSQASLAICEHIQKWEPFRTARVILTYLPIKSEVDLRALIDNNPDQIWVAPRIIPEQDHAMVFHRYDADRLVRHPFGMDEPDPGLPVIPPEQVDLALVPGLAFDRRGWRLGYGGGYYDRFLAGFKGISVGICYEALVLNEVPHAPHDRRMDWLASESGVYRASSDANSPNLSTARSIG